MTTLVKLDHGGRWTMRFPDGAEATLIGVDRLSPMAEVVFAAGAAAQRWGRSVKFKEVWFEQ